MAATKPHYSNSQVKKAGKYWAKLAQAYNADGMDAFNRFDPVEMAHTDAIIAWWRGRHAYPLTMVNANLRHYVADYDSQVTQRLKRDCPNFCV